MLKALSLALLIVASSASALAKNTTIAPPTHVCRSPDELIEKFVDAVVVDDLTGPALKAFNEAYALTGNNPPALDRAVIFTSKANPDTETYLMIGSRGDCVVGVQPISKENYLYLRHPGQGI
jgi:hypothetical protein